MDKNNALVSTRMAYRQMRAADVEAARVMAEAFEVPREEYDELLDKYWGKDGNFANSVKRGDEAIESMVGPAVVESSGNVLVKYTETEQAMYVFGMLSKSGRMTKEDQPDARLWLNRLAKVILKQGKTVLTSLNQFSRPMIDNLRKHNPEIQTYVVHESIGVGGAWTTVALYKDEVCEEVRRLAGIPSGRKGRRTR